MGFHLAKQDMGGGVELMVGLCYLGTQFFN